MTNSTLSAGDLLAKVEQNQIKFIDLQFTDVVGVVKNVTIPAAELADALENGIWFDGSSIEGFARIAESDMHLRPDIATFSIVPWLSGEEATGRLICNVFTPDGQPFFGDPRAVLIRAVAAAAELGFTFNTGPELEFFLLKPDANGASSFRPCRTMRRVTSMCRPIWRPACAVRWLIRWPRSASKWKRCITKWPTASTRSTFATRMRCARPTMR